MSDLKRELSGVKSSDDLPLINQIETFESIPKFFNRIIEQLNRRFKKLSLTGNFDSDTVAGITIPATTSVKIRHRLNVVPSYRIILRQSGGGAIVDVDSGWDDKYIELTNTGASDTILTVGIYKE
jgi:hypothetical protein